MPLTTKQVAELEANQSRYGCGRTTCLACYPVQYACDYCAETFPNPIANGESYYCEACDFSSSELETC